MRNIFLLLLLLLISDLAFGQFTDLQESKLRMENLVENGGAESQLDKWSETGGGTLTTDLSIKRTGKAAIKFTSSATSDYLNFPITLVKRGTNNCEAHFYYRTTSAVFDAEVYINSVKVAILDLNAVTDFTKAIISFVCTDITNATQVKITNGAASDMIYVDDAYVGESLNIGSVNLEPKQYDLTVTGTNWTTTRAIGEIRKTRDGAWRMVFNIVGTYSSGTPNVDLSVAGVTFKTVTNGQTFSGSQNSSSAAEYTTIIANAISGTSTLRIRFDSSSSPTAVLFAGDVELDSKPTFATDYAAEQVVRAENANMLWAGYHGGDCGGWSRTSTSIGDYSADASCTLTEQINKSFVTVASATTGGANFLPGIRFTPNQVGFYEICGALAYRFDNGNTGQIILTDGTNSYGQQYMISNTAGMGALHYSCGFFEATDITTEKVVKFQTRADVSNAYIVADGSSKAIQWTIKKVFPTMPMPQIVNSVGTNHPGVVSIAAANIGQSGNYAAVCSSSPCGIFNSFGISGVTRSGTGAYPVAFSSGVFSQAPVCQCTGKSDAGADRICIVQSQSSTGVLIGLYNDAGTAVDGNPSITCTGIKQ